MTAVAPMVELGKLEETEEAPYASTVRSGCTAPADETLAKGGTDMEEENAPGAGRKQRL